VHKDNIYSEEFHIFKQLICMLCLQYLIAVAGRSEIRSTERSIIVSLSVGKYHAGFLKVISPYCPLLISARMVRYRLSSANELHKVVTA